MWESQDPPPAFSLQILVGRSGLDSLYRTTGSTRDTSQVLELGHVLSRLEIKFRENIGK
jgi:hypothetical protein